MDLNGKQSGIFRWVVSMSECNLMRILHLAGLNYGKAVMGGLKLRVIQGYRV